MPDPTYAIVPVAATQKMIDASVNWNPDRHGNQVDAAIAASPSQGRVTQAMLERAAEAIGKKWGFDTIPGLGVEVARTVAEQFGLAVEDAP